MYYLILQALGLFIFAMIGALFIQFIAKFACQYKPAYLLALKAAVSIWFCQAAISIAYSLVILDSGNSLPKFIVIAVGISALLLTLYIGMALVRKFIVPPTKEPISLTKAFLISLGNYAAVFVLPLIYQVVGYIGKAV